MPRFFVPEVGGKLRISGEDAAHIARSLRMVAGDTLTVCDGAGMEYACTIADMGGDWVELIPGAGKPSAREPSLRVTLFQGLPKGDKLDWIVQKAVELGVDSVAPVLCERSVARPDSAGAAKRIARLNRVAAEAAGQCERGRLSAVTPLLTFSQALARLAGFAHVAVCYEGGGTPLAQVLPAGARELALFIGPEGGISPAELKALAPYPRVTLGPRILRCETAPVVALALAMHITGNLR